MKIFILLETFYNYDSGEEVKSVVIGAYKNKEKAIKELKKCVNDNVQNFGFVEDEQKKASTKIIFWNYQENWNNYIEYEIIERTIE